MIRHTISVRADPGVRSAELNACLSGLQDGDSVKLSQRGQQIYLVYRLSEKMGEGSVGVAMQLMRLNRIEDGTCLVERYPSARAEHLRVRVNALDWKIVNLNQVKIAMSFLEQVSIVWAGAAIPIYYDDLNFVTVTPLCEKVSRLDVNTTVQFLEEEIKKQRLIKQQQGDQIEQEMVQILDSRLHMSNYCDFKEGYLNVLTVDKQLIDRITAIEQQHLWIVENDLQFSDCPSINQFLEFQKQQQANHNKSDLPSKKLVFLEADLQNRIGINQYQCSKLCKKVIGVSDTVRLGTDTKYRPNIEAMSFEVFVINPNMTIKVQEIITDQSLISPLEFQNLYQTLIKEFAQQILNSLYKTGSFYLLQTSYPYSFHKKLYLISLQHKKAQKENQIYKLKLINDDQSKRQLYFSQLVEGKIIFTTKRYYHSQGKSTLQQRYEEIDKWVSVLKQHWDEQAIKHIQQSSEQAMTTLFKGVYRPELDKMMVFLQNREQNRCLVTSFGNNGKTLFHHILELERQRMWKVSFRQLSNPSLSYSNIDLYLHWIFATSPYNIIFLDDLDSLCGKVEEGDQQRKKEKIISKLIIRSINRFSSLYNRKIIATAKSESSLDEEFRPQVIIVLKNPNREQRESALQELHVVIKPDDSPIHRVEHELVVKRHVKKSTLTAIAESTESLSLAAFSKHAIKLTQPTSVSVSQLFDFNKLAGLTSAKATIKSIIEKPIKYAFLFRSVPIKLPRGVLLYGATGNGKSALGTAAKDEFKMKYFSVKGSDILSKYIGGSQAAVRDIFEKALSVSPSIIFFDQFQSIVPKRSANNTGVNDRIVNQFLCYLDGVSSTSGVYIVAASSRPDLIDAAVLRPGRLDAHLFLDYPTPEERAQLIGLYSNSVQIELEEEDIVAATHNFSYSDMAGLFKQLRIKRSTEVLAMQSYDSSSFTKISKELFNRTIETFKLSVTPSDQQRQRKLFQSFKEGRAPDIRQQRQIQQ